MQVKKLNKTYTEANSPKMPPDITRINVAPNIEQPSNPFTASIVKNGLPAMVGAFAAAATGGVTVVPALGIGAAVGLGFAWLSKRRQPA